MGRPYRRQARLVRVVGMWAGVLGLGGLPGLDWAAGSVGSVGAVPVPALAPASSPAPAPAPDGPAQSVEVIAKLPGARDEKTLAQLLAARAAFEAHHALAPRAGLGFRLYARLDERDLARLRLYRVSGDDREPVALDAHQRFTIDPAWTAPGADPKAVLQTNLPDGAVAWKVDVRTPGFDGETRRLGDLRLECEADTFHGNLQRGLRTPVSALLAADGKLCQLDDSEVWFAEEPVFGVTLRHGTHERRLPYRYLHGSDGTMALASLFDWPFQLRDRTYFLPLDDRAWPDDTQVVMDDMAAPQPGFAAPSGAVSPSMPSTLPGFDTPSSAATPAATITPSESGP